jgi:RHS repeat-associated protein
LLPAGTDLHTLPILSLIKDDNKQITSIQYNHLNLPVHIDIATKPAQEGGRIEYLYDAAGIKLRQTKYIGATPDEETNYIGNFAYEGESSLKYIITDDGRLIPKTGGGFEYEYFIKDHLGNTRLTVQDSSGFAAIKQENHYYPFGMALGGQSWRNSTQTTKNDYLYNGKEYQGELGLDWYDYGARFYDPVIARWHSVDPLAEKTFGLSPYVYCANAPILLDDPDGRDWIVSTRTNKNGTTTWIITYKAAVYNGSSYRKDLSGEKMTNFMESIKSQYNHFFGGNEGNMEFKIDLRVINKKKELGADESLIEIVNPATFGFKEGQETGGDSRLGGKHVRISANFIDANGAIKDKKTAAHEIGHQGGLLHPFEMFDKGQSLINGRIVPIEHQKDAYTHYGNFMSYPHRDVDRKYNVPGNVPSKNDLNKEIRAYQNNPGKATIGQKLQILRNYQAGFLNTNDIPK